MGITKRLWNNTLGKRQSGDQFLALYLTPVRFYLKIIGLWTDKENFFDTKHYWKYTLFVCGYLTGTFNILYFLTWIISMGDLTLLVTTSHDAIMSIMSSVKAYWIIKHWPLIFKLLEQINSKEFQPQNERQKQISNDFAYTFLYCYYVQNVFLVLVIFTYWTIPLIKNGEKNLAFELYWYPYNETTSIFYEYTLIHQYLVILYSPMIHVHVDGLFMLLIIYVGVQCDLLADTLKNLYEFTAEKVEKNQPRNKQSLRNLVLKEMENGLINCIEHHKKVLLFKKGVEQIYRVLIFLQFAASLISLCATLFQLSILEASSSTFFAVISYSSALLFELGLYCWFGNEIILKSLNLHGAIYECDWLDCSIKFKKMMVLFMLRVQTPMKVLAVDMFVLGNETFKYIVRTSWSAFAVLSQKAQ